MNTVCTGAALREQHQALRVTKPAETAVAFGCLAAEDGLDAPKGTSRPHMAELINVQFAVLPALAHSNPLSTISVATATFPHLGDGPIRHVTPNARSALGLTQAFGHHQAPKLTSTHQHIDSEDLRTWSKARTVWV